MLALRPFVRQPAGLHLSSVRSSSSTTSTVHLANTSRTVKYARRAAYTGVGLGLAYFADRELQASAITRNLRTLATCAVIAADYKLNFSEANDAGIPELQERVADRIYNLITANGGLYIKMGQAIGSNGALLPKPMQEKFGKLFDDAPQVPYSAVRTVFVQEFRCEPAGPDGMFEVFEEQAIASASIAQVHRAKLKSPDGNGDWVAVKIQKPDVSKQVDWDLAAFKAVMWMYEHWVFGIPVTFVSDFIADHLRRELDFVAEARNASMTASFVAREPRLRERVHVPRVYTEHSGQRVLTAEWIDGVRLSNRSKIQAMLDHGESVIVHTPTGDRAIGPLRGGVKEVMGAMIDVFCAQIFEWGWIHCDPHPGNVIIRPHPTKPNVPQLVLLDHGLYVRTTPEFRAQYAALWKALMTMDQEQISQIISGWGFGAPDLFASATLMRPVRFPQSGGKKKEEVVENKLSHYELGVKMKAKLQSFIQDTDKMPKELTFIGRNMRIVQGNNQSFGSPVNRIHIMGHWASRALISPDRNLPWRERALEVYSFTAFRAAMLAVDALFFVSRVRYWARGLLGLSRESFEDELERTMRGVAKDSMGLDIAPGAFEG